MYLSITKKREILKELYNEVDEIIRIQELDKMSERALSDKSDELEEAYKDTVGKEIPISIGLEPVETELLISEYEKYQGSEWITSVHKTIMEQLFAIKVVLSKRNRDYNEYVSEVFNEGKLTEDYSEIYYLYQDVLNKKPPSINDLIGLSEDDYFKYLYVSIIEKEVFNYRKISGSKLDCDNCEPFMDVESVVIYLDLTDNGEKRYEYTIEFNDGVKCILKEKMEYGDIVLNDDYPLDSFNKGANSGECLLDIASHFEIEGWNTAYFKYGIESKVKWKVSVNFNDADLSFTSVGDSFLHIPDGFMEVLDALLNHEDTFPIRLEENIEKMNLYTPDIFMLNPFSVNIPDNFKSSLNQNEYSLRSMMYSGELLTANDEEYDKERLDKYSITKTYNLNPSILHNFKDLYNTILNIDSNYGLISNHKLLVDFNEIYSRDNLIRRQEFSYNRGFDNGIEDGANRYGTYLFTEIEKIAENVRDINDVNEISKIFDESNMVKLRDTVYNSIRLELKRLEEIYIERKSDTKIYYIDANGVKDRLRPLDFYNSDNVFYEYGFLSGIIEFYKGYVKDSVILA